MNRGAASHPEVVAAAKNGNGGIKHGRLLVALAVCVGLLFAGILFGRAAQTDKQAEALCRKIDRFIVATERAVKASETLTPEEKAARLKFYEEFRNDPPVCRTEGP